MFPKNIDCLEIETNGSYCKAVTWIFVVTVTLVIGSSILGAWDVAQNDFQQNVFEMSFVPENKYSEESFSEIKNSVDLSQEIMTSSEKSEDSFSGATLCGSSDVSVPEKGCFDEVNVGPGEMDIALMNIPAELPIKVDNASLEGYYIIVGEVGGYSWVDGYIKVMQAKTGVNIWQNIKGYIDINAELIDDIDAQELAKYEHGWTYYNLTFEVRGKHPIILDANSPPLNMGDFTVWFDGNTDLDKFVTLKVVTEWKGCNLPSQHFVVILAQEVMSQNKIPSSR
ncbi:MAG: hypothetical protein ACXADU_03225 [Promethearchaeota archaeon]|jgi:hypothetical protein